MMPIVPVRTVIGALAAVTWLLVIIATFLGAINPKVDAYAVGFLAILGLFFTVAYFMATAH